MKSSAVIISGGVGNLILVMSCHAPELFFEKVSKLSTFLRARLVFLEKLKRLKTKDNV